MVRDAIEILKSAVVEGRQVTVGPGQILSAGGGMEQGEAALTAACRELAEELGMKVYRAERFINYTKVRSFNDHKVVLVSAGSEPGINDRELESFRWWDRRERLLPHPHVTSIIGRYEAASRNTIG